MCILGYRPRCSVCRALWSTTLPYVRVLHAIKFMWGALSARYQKVTNQLELSTTGEGSPQGPRQKTNRACSCFSPAMIFSLSVAPPTPPSTSQKKPAAITADGSDVICPVRPHTNLILEKTGNAGEAGSATSSAIKKFMPRFARSRADRSRTHKNLKKAEGSWTGHRVLNPAPEN